jgi:hypothetical protein
VQAFANLADSLVTAVPKVAMGIVLVIGTLLTAKLIKRFYAMR